MVTASSFAVELPTYAGPLELLLYLVRREELDLTAIHLSTITKQFCEYLDILTVLSVDDVGDFIETASILLEMKAKSVLPLDSSSTSDESNEIDDPTEELVHRLIEYKKYRDAAIILDEHSRRWQLRHARQVDTIPFPMQQQADPSVARVEIWDMVSAFGRILRENQPVSTESIVYDSTPIHQHMQRIHRTIQEKREVELQSLFTVGAHKSALVAIFLATLELTRHHGLLTEWDEHSDSLMLRAGTNFPEVLDVTELDSFSEEELRKADLPIARK